MLRRRLMMVAINMARIYGEMKVAVYNKVRVVAAPITAILAKLESGLATSNKIDSKTYDASLSESNNTVVVKQSIDVNNYDASIADSAKEVNVNIAINSHSYNASIAESKNKIVIHKMTGAVASGEVLSDYDKHVVNHVLVDGDKFTSKLADLHVEVYGKYGLSASGVDPSDASLESYIADDPSITADSIYSSLSSLDETKKSCTHVFANPTETDCVKANTSTNNAIIVTFAPTAKIMEWLDPVFTDGALLIRQAYDVNKNNNTLEVI